MIISVCIGSSCHLKGARQVVEGLQQLVKSNDLDDKITMKGQFCMGNCVNGVSVMVDSELFSVKPEAVSAFFADEVLPRLK